MEEAHKEVIDTILSSYEREPGKLVPILLDVQAGVGYLPGEAVDLIAGFLGIAEGEVYSVASFYTQFRLTPLGRHRVTVCRGTACHIRGAPQILRQIEEQIGIPEGETSPDLEYTLESAACIGCCALAPCIKINEHVHGEMTTQKVAEVFSALNTGGQDAR